MKINYKSIGSKIKYFRTQQGLSQEELAEFADVSYVYISNIERGEKRPSLTTLVAIANAMNASVDSILADSLNTKTNDSYNELFSLLSDCTKEENKIIVELIIAIKKTLRQYIIK